MYNSPTQDPSQSPLSSMSSAALSADYDSRDSLFSGENEQTYSGPAASVLTPPIDPVLEVDDQDAQFKTESLRPLL